MALHVTNKTMNAIKEVRVIVTPPSCLRVKKLSEGMADDPKQDELMANSAFCHVTYLVYQSPSPKMVLDGQVLYEFINFFFKIVYQGYQISISN